MTITELSRTAVPTAATTGTGAPASETRRPASGTPGPVSGAPEDPSGARLDASGETMDRPPRRPLTPVQKVIAAAIVLAALTLAGIGLYLSFEHVAAFAHERLGFKTLKKGQLFTLGVDTGIMVLIAVDLLMAWLKRPISYIRYVVWLLTLVTIVLNAASAAPRGRGWGLLDYVAAGSHAVVPILFIVVIEVGRTSIDRIVRPTERKDRSSPPFHRWVLSPVPTARLYRRMRLWGIHSYEDMVRREQDLRGYEIWLKRQHGGDLSEATDDELLPMTMAPYGYTVAQALALPDEQQKQAEQRQEEAEARKTEAATRAHIRTKQAEEDRLRADGQAAVTKAQVDAETSQAKAKAQAAATLAERTANLEQELAETAAMARSRAEAEEAREREAESREAAAETARRAAEIERQAALHRKEAREADAQAAQGQARVQAAQEETERSRQAAAEARERAAETRLRVAEIERRAVEAEDVARLTPRQRAVRRVARMVLVQAGGDAERLPLEDIKHELKVSSPATASEYRQEAAELLADGYQPDADRPPMAA